MLLDVAIRVLRPGLSREARDCQMAAGRQPVKPRAVNQFSRPFVGRVMAISALTGAAIETFMARARSVIATRRSHGSPHSSQNNDLTCSQYFTGFWQTVSRIEAERRAGIRD